MRNLGIAAGIALLVAIWALVEQRRLNRKNGKR